MSSSEHYVLPNGPNPLRECPPPPFIDTRRDGVHVQGIVEVVVFPNRGGTVVEHCGKYTVGYGVGRGSCPGHRPWSCRDRAGVLAAPAGGVVVAVGVPSFKRGVAAFRGSYRPGSCPSQGRSRFRGSCNVVRGLRGRESMKEVWGVGSIVAGAVQSTSCTASQVPTVSSQRPEW